MIKGYNLAAYIRPLTQGDGERANFFWPNAIRATDLADRFLRTIIYRRFTKLFSQNAAAGGPEKN